MYREATMARMDRAIAAATATRNPKRKHWDSGPGSEPIEWVAPSVKLPDLEIKITDLSANTFFMVSHVRSRIEHYLHDTGDTWEDARAEGAVFFNEALSGDADHALRTVLEWVTIDG